MGKKGAGISKEGARKTAKHMPRDAHLFMKLSKVQSMQCIVKLQQVFCFDTIKQSREVNTVKLTVYICFLKTTRITVCSPNLYTGSSIFSQFLLVLFLKKLNSIAFVCRSFVFILFCFKD